MIQIDSLNREERSSVNEWSMRDSQGEHDIVALRLHQWHSSIATTCLLRAEGALSLQASSLNPRRTCQRYAPSKTPRVLVDAMLQVQYTNRTGTQLGQIQVRVPQRKLLRMMMSKMKAESQTSSM